MLAGNPFPVFLREEDIDEATFIDRLTPSDNNPLLAKAGCETWVTAWAPDQSYFAWSSGSKIVKLIPWNSCKHRIIPEEEQLSSYGTVTIDAKELVWALAFGSSFSDTRPGSVALNSYRYSQVTRTDLILVTGGKSGKIRTWNVRTGQLLLVLMDHRDTVRDLRFAPDGSKRLASASRDGSIKLWDLKEEGNMFKTLRGDSKWLYACAWSPDSQTLVAVGDKRSVILWDMRTLQRKHKLSGHYHDVVACDFSPDGALLATSSYDTRVILWDPHLGLMLFQLGHLFPPPSAIFAGGANGSYVRGVSFCHDGHHVASVADDGFVRFWDISNPEAPEQYATVSNPLCCQYSPDGAALAVGTRDGSVSFWLSPMRVLSLQHMCRLGIRRNLQSASIPSLELPQRMKKYLAYLDT